jgi:chromosomal replication initiator protein
MLGEAKRGRQMQTARVAKKGAWELVLADAANRIDSALFESWILPLSASVSENVIRVSAANQFSADFIRRSFLEALSAAAAQIGCTIELMAAGAVNDNACNVYKPAHNAQRVTRDDFSKFIISEDNTFAISAVKKMCSGAAFFSPLFIYGPSGCGKSLLARIANDAAHGKVVFLTAAQFVSEFLRAISEKTIFAFKDFVRNCDMLIIEDIQGLIGKRASGEEFRDLMSDMIRMGKSVLITSNAAPAALTGFDRGLQAMLASGLVADMAAPDATTCAKIMVASGMDSDIASSLAGKMRADGHLAVGAAKKVAAYRELMDCEVTFEVAERLLADAIKKTRSPLGIAREMSQKLGVAFEEIESSSRTRTVVRARQIIMCALKQTTTLSLTEIGRVLGDRDHTTVLYGLAQIEKQKETDLVLSAEIEMLIKEI